MECKNCREPVKPHWLNCPVCRLELVVVCPDCGAAGAPGQERCSVCSCVLHRACDACHAALQPGWAACPHCGTRAADSAVEVAETVPVLSVANESGDSVFPQAGNGLVMSEMMRPIADHAMPMTALQAARPVLQPEPTRPVPKGRVFSDSLSDGSDGPEMVEIAPGSFRMGDIEGLGGPEEQPVHTVTIGRPFAIGRYPVTFAEYDQYCARTGRIPSEDGGWGRGPRPVIIVSWECAQEYVQWLSTETGVTYRLPSEAEWEYAARAGAETAFPWGGPLESSRANYLGDGAPSRTTPVGLYPANAFGVYDMHGNVWEWVEDVWHENYEGAPLDGSAWNAGGDPLVHVLRGGSWYAFENRTRSSARNWFHRTGRNVSMGFRLARDL